MKENDSGRMNSIGDKKKRIVKLSSFIGPRFFLSWLTAVAMIFQATLTPVTVAADLRNKTRANARPAEKAASTIEPATVLQAGSSIILHGPQRFDYQPGPARNVYAQFTLPIASPIAGTLLVQNGAAGGADRVTGAIIQLNGALLSTARAVNLNTATVNIAANLLVSNSLSVRIVGAPGSYLTITILARPIITALSPASARAGDTININGDFFDDSGPGQNIIRFTKAGGGQTTAQVTTATRAQLAVVVPADADSGPVSVQTAGGIATSPADFQLIPPAPVIADFTPKRARIGEPITLTGVNLKIGASNPTVTFAGANNIRLPAAVTSATTTQVAVTVPNAAVTGVIELTHTGGLAATSVPFLVDTTQDFQIIAAPSTAAAVQGSLANYVITLTSQQPDFTQLAALSLQGAPAGSTVTFTPDQITAGASSTLSLRTASNLSPGNYQFTVRAMALIDGVQTVRAANATVNVLAAGQTTLSGRVLNEDREPIHGATVSLDGSTATTDAAGGFLLSGVNAGVDRPVMVDGRTASAPNRSYPVIAEPATIVAGQSNVVPYDFILPKIDTQFEVTVVPNQDTVVATPRLANLSMTIPAGANLRNRDGSPVARVSISPVAIDRTPAPLPSNLGTVTVFTSQPGGAVADLAMPVVYPNQAGADPNTRVALYNFNHDTVTWFVYGFGRVSADGRTIVPEIDPATGRPYGLRDFSWHFPNVAPGGNPGDEGCGENCCQMSNSTSNKVDLSTGMKIEATTDIDFGGARGSLVLKRIYTSDLSGVCDSCPFGRGTTHNYAITLTGSFQNGGTGRVVMPGQISGRLFNYTSTDPDGALVFTTTATTSQLGDVVRKLTNGTFEYRYRQGGVLRFDTTGRLVAMVDRNGNTTTLDYTGSNLTGITDAVGRSIILQYSGNRISRAIDPLERTWQYGYDGGNRLVIATDPLGKVSSYTYDAVSRLISITDKRNNVVKQISYDGAGRVGEQRFADGGFERYSYTLSGRVVTAVTITDSLGHTETKRFNASGYVLETTDALGQSSRTELDLSNNLPLSTIGPCGCLEAVRQFDSRGNVTAITDRLGHTETYEYDPVFSQLTRMTDKLGRVTIYNYDPRGNRISMTNALNQTTTYGYDQFGQMTSITDPLGHISRMEYDTQGNVAARINGAGDRTTLEYDGVGRLTAVIDPLGRRTGLSYDALDRVVSMTDPSGAVTRFSYDPNGNQISITDALNRVWNNTFDSKNRLISSTDPLGRATSMQYDADNRLITRTSPSGRTTRYSYDARGQLAMTTDPMGDTILFSYDNRKNLIALTDERGNTTTFMYDKLFRQIGRRDPLGRLTSFAYDSAGNVIETIDRMGRRTTRAYDTLNRPTQITYADATVTYSYDAAGRRTRNDDTQSGFIEWSYDSANRLLAETTPSGVVSYIYNPAGQRASMTAADRQPVTYGYDAAGRLQTITQGTEVFTYSYDALSRRAGLQRPNGVATSYSYDEVGRLIRILHKNALNQPIEDFNYSYNTDDEIESIASLFPHRLMPAAKVASVADPANRVSQFGASGFSFDLEGQTVEKADAQGANLYQWDARGRLAQITLPNGQEISYGFDALGRRTSRTADGVITRFLHDGDDVVLDRGSDGSAMDYLNGLAIDHKLRQKSISTGSIYFLPDHLGSTAALTNDAGNLVELSQYEAFGETQGSALTRYGYTGRERDAATMLMYYRARFYNPTMGRFISEDPIGFGGGDLNLYQYVANSPIGNIDPDGQQPVSVTVAGGFGPTPSPRPIPIRPTPIPTPITGPGSCHANGERLRCKKVPGRTGPSPAGTDRCLYYCYDADTGEFLFYKWLTVPDPPGCPPEIVESI